MNSCSFLSGILPTWDTFPSLSPTVRNQAPARCPYLRVHLTDAQTEVREAKQLAENTQQLSRTQCFALSLSRSSSNLSSPTSGSSLPWTPHRNHSILLMELTALVSSPLIFTGPRGQSAHALSLEVSLPPRAKDAAKQGPAGAQGLSRPHRVP